MKYLNIVFLLFLSLSFAQSEVSLVTKDSMTLKVDKLIAIDNFETMYYTKGNILYKKPKDQEAINFSNVQLGIPTTINAYNPLKINMFFQDFNYVIILDNRLAEIFEIDFNVLQPYRFVTHVSTGYDNTLWIFNQDIQQLELYDYLNNSIRVTTVPVQSNVLDLKSDYNYCWMLTEKYLYQYTYFGSLISKIENKGYTEMALSKDSIILKSDSGLYHKSKESGQIQALNTPKLLINQFLLTNETLYIYDSNKLHSYQLKIE